MCAQVCKIYDENSYRPCENVPNVTRKNRTVPDKYVCLKHVLRWGGDPFA